MSPKRQDNKKEYGNPDRILEELADSRQRIKEIWINYRLKLITMYQYWLTNDNKYTNMGY